MSAYNCLRVNLYRDAAHNNALPTFFARLLGVTSQDMKATATAGVLIGGASDCLAPFALPDRWTEVDDPPFKQEKSKYRIYDWDKKTDAVKARGKADVYVAPGPGGTGYKFTDSWTKKVMKVDDVTLKTKKDKTLEQTFADLALAEPLALEREERELRRAVEQA